MKEFTEEMYDSDEIQRIGDFLALVKKGEPWRIPTERLIRLNGNFRRGKYVNQTIGDALKEHGLVCTPEIDNADFYGDVVISDPRDELPERADMASLPLSAFPSEFGDLIYCGQEMPVMKVQTLMTSYDISQVPVLSGDKKIVHGVVTWRSLAQRREGAIDLKASDVMVKAGHVASSGDDFLELVDIIINQEYVLYRIPDGRVNGIVTASDLAKAFDGTASLYIKLQELESRLRILLDRASIPQLKKHLEPKRRNMKKFRGATDMMFGEYLAALADEEIWTATGILFDRETCQKYLEEVRAVRNGVMHFAATSRDATETERKNDDAIMRALRVLRAVPLK